MTAKSLTTRDTSEHGCQFILHADRQLMVRTADGFPSCIPRRAEGNLAQLDPSGQVSEEPLSPTHCDERLDLGYTASVLLRQAA